MIRRLRAIVAMPALERNVLAFALVLNPFMLWYLRARGTRAALQLVERLSARRLARRRRQAGDEVISVASRIGSSVNRAAREPAPSVTCLARSLTTQLLLRRRGIDADLRIGVAPDAAAARVGRPPEWSFHAWVEVCGVPVNDVSDVAQTFAVFPLGLHDATVELRSSGFARGGRSRKQRSAQE